MTDACVGVTNNFQSKFPVSNFLKICQTASVLIVGDKRTDVITDEDFLHFLIFSLLTLFKKIK
jgi:hypothetical protein